MIKIFPMSRRQQRKMKRRLIAAMCVTLATNSLGIYGQPITFKVGSQKITVAGPAEVKAATMNSNPEIPEGEYTEVNISQLTINEYGKRVCDITESGVYLLTGSNYDSEQGYVPTQVVVEQGVKATIYLKDFNIQNNDGSFIYDSNGDIDIAATLPMKVKGDCTLKLLSDASMRINVRSNTLEIDSTGSLILEDSVYQLSLSCENADANNKCYPLSLGGQFIMNGSHLRIEGSQFNEQIEFRDNGKIIINGGYFDDSKEARFLYSKGNRIVVNGGKYNDVSSYDDVSAKRCSPICFLPLTGLPANTKIDMIQQYYNSGEVILNYGTAGVTTDDKGEVIIGCLSMCDYDSTKLGMLLKCGKNYYKVTYDLEDIFDMKLVANQVDADKIHKLTYYDMDTSQMLGSMYTIVDEAGTSALKYPEDTAQYTYHYYLTKSTGGEAFNYTSLFSDRDIYVKREKKSYEVSVTGMPSTSYTVPYKESIPNADQYMFITPDNKIWDGVVTGAITVAAYPCTTIDGVKYMNISSLADLTQFREFVNNNGLVNLNGYLTADIDAGNWASIGTSTNVYKGCFNGNGHKVTLAINETANTNARAFFGYIGNGAVIRNLLTAGTITSNGKYTAGIVGQVNGNCTIENCGSDVAITFTPGGDATSGGMIGQTYAGIATLKNCYYTGSMKSGTSGVALQGQGGLVGWNSSYSSMEAYNCFVNASFDSAATDPGENLSRGGGHFYNCYYVKPCKATSNQGIQISTEKIATAEFAHNLNTTNGTTENSRIWSYVNGAEQPVYATDTLMPIYRVTFTDEGVYDSKRLSTEYRYTTCNDNKVTIPALTDGFLETGHTPYWKLADGEKITSDTVITGDCQATLAIETANTYTFSIVGDMLSSFTGVAYGAKLSGLLPTSEYVFVDEDGNRITKADGTFTTLTAYKLITIGDKQYFNIKDLNTLQVFGTLVNKGYTNLNGALTADIDTSSITSCDAIVIGKDMEHTYTGIFQGNGHTVTLNLKETGAADYTALFGYVGYTAVIDHLYTTGTIETTAKYAGGIVGIIKGYDASRKVQIKNCGSTVNITYTGTDVCYIGGLVGNVDSTYLELYTNYYSGTLTSNGSKNYCSGLVGYDFDRIVSSYGCYVNMTLGMDATKNLGYNFVYREAERSGSIIDSYYMKDNGSVQGTALGATSAEYANKMNQVINSHASYGLIPFAYDAETGSIIHSDDTHQKPYRITLQDSGVYSNKTYSTSYLYTDSDGHGTLPDMSSADMSSFLLPGHTAHWYLGEEEVTDSKVYSSDTVLNLRVTFDGTYDINISGDDTMLLEDCHYGASLPEGYVYVKSDGSKVTKVDGTFTEVTRYQLITVSGVEYFLINSPERLEKFCSFVNSGNTTLNGYLSANLSVGDWKPIGDKSTNAYTGSFEGNGHIITLAINETGGTESRAFFGYLGNGAVIRNLITTGTITSNGKFTAGIAGRVEGNCTIENCGSDVAITFTPGGDTTSGGMIGVINSGTATLKNCYYTGSMMSGTDGAALTGQGGLVGWKNAGLNAYNCFVNATFESKASDPGENLSRNGGNFYNCYYVNACKASSNQGTQISAENLASAKFAYNLNTTNGTTENSRAWSYVTDAKHPVYATDSLKPACKVTFTSDTEPVYENVYTTSYGYSNSEGKIALPDFSTYIKAGDTAGWYIGEELVNNSYVVTADKTAVLKIKVSLENAISMLQSAYAVAYAENDYTTASYKEYIKIQNEAGTLLALSDKTSCTSDQVLDLLKRLKGAQSKLVATKGTVTMTCEGSGSFTPTTYGAGRYATGDQVTISATAITGYNFLGWYKDGSATAACTSRSFTYTFGEANESYVAKYEALPQSVVTIAVNGSAFTITSSDSQSGDQYIYRNGTSVTVTDMNPSEDFAYWTDANGFVLSTSQSYTFTVVGDTTITAVYNKKVEENSSIVVFQNAYGQVLSRTEYVKGATEDTIVFPDAPSKSGYNFIGWSMMPNDITKIIGVNNIITVTPVFEQKQANYSVTVTDGQITGATTTAVGEGVYLENTNVTVTANTPSSGYKFSHWEDGVGTVLSYNETFTTIINSDTVLKAVYVEEAQVVVAMPSISISSASSFIENSVIKVSFISVRDIPEGYSMLSHGIILTSDGSIATGESFVIGTAGVLNGKATTTSKKGAFTVIKKNAGANVTWYAKAYVIYTDKDGNISTIYSPISTAVYVQN